MMQIQLRLLLILGSIVFFMYILRFIKKSKMSLNMASIWIVWGVGVILIAFFPEIITWLGGLMGIYSQLNTIFFVMLAILYMLVFYLFVKISILEEKLKNMIQAAGIRTKDN